MTDQRLSELVDQICAPYARAMEQLDELASRQAARPSMWRCVTGRLRRPRVTVLEPVAVEAAYQNSDLPQPVAVVAVDPKPDPTVPDLPPAARMAELLRPFAKVPGR